MTIFAGAATALALLMTVVPASQMAQQNYRPGTIIVAYRDDITVPSDRFEVAPERIHALQLLAARGSLDDDAVPHYTSDVRTNRTLLDVGATQSVRLFANAPTGNPLLKKAYRLSIVTARVTQAVAELHRLPSVVYASPDWYVQPMRR